MGTATAPQMERKQKGEVAAPLRTCNLKKLIGTRIVEVDFLRARTDGAEEVLAGWCSQVSLACYELRPVRASI